MEEELERLRETLAQVHKDSREIEEELEAEILTREEAYREVEKKLHDALAETSKWQSKCINLETRNEKLEIKLESTQEELNGVRKRLNVLETENDDMELNSRVSEGTLQYLEAENNRLIEALALKEVDMAYHEQLTEELQHTKQELVEAQEEIRNLQQERSNKQINPSIDSVQRAPSLRRMASVIDQVGGLHERLERISQNHNQLDSQQQQQHHPSAVLHHPKTTQHIPPQCGGSLHPTKLRSSEWVLMDVHPTRVNASSFGPLHDGKLSHGRGHGLHK